MFEGIEASAQDAHPAVMNSGKELKNFRRLRLSPSVAEATATRSTDFTARLKARPDEW